MSIKLKKKHHALRGARCTKYDVKNVSWIVGLCCFSFVALGQNQLQKTDIDASSAFRYKAYLGGTIGYGSTTWQGLVPSEDNQNMAIRLSAPMVVREGGTVWGVLGGYEFSPFFALEASFMQYPRATISFDEDSLFAFENDGSLVLSTKTNVASLMGKIMLVVPKTTIRAFSSFGIASVHRVDSLDDETRLSPTFGFGLNYNLVPHVMAEAGVNYTAGYGESELSPANDFIPFLYSVFLRLAYRI